MTTIDGLDAYQEAYLDAMDGVDVDVVVPAPAKGLWEARWSFIGEHTGLAPLLVDVNGCALAQHGTLRQALAAALQAHAARYLDDPGKVIVYLTPDRTAGEAFITAGYHLVARADLTRVSDR